MEGRTGICSDGSKYSGVRIGISSPDPIRPTAPFQFCAVAVLTILDSYVVGVGTKTNPV